MDPANSRANASISGSGRASTSRSLPPIPRTAAIADVGIQGRNGNMQRKMIPRVIRTFEEIDKVVTTEEWYEELECGVCSYILGATQALVPCGHSLCGPCAWQWIRKNKNMTCPHCRVELDPSTPYVPNIVVDQIIERKLSGLKNTAEKGEMVLERQSKIDSWKLLQAAIEPRKPIPRRSRGFDDTILGIFSTSPSEASGPSRRASRHLPALGEPLPRRIHLQASGPHLSELRRLGAEEDAMVARAEIRRLRENMLREQLNGLHALTEEPEQIRPQPRPQEQNSGPPVPPSMPDRSYTSPILRPGIARAQASRSQILAARQARGRGSRDQPLVVLSDSD